MLIEFIDKIVRLLEKEDTEYNSDEIDETLSQDSFNQLGVPKHLPGVPDDLL